MSDQKNKFGAVMENLDKHRERDSRQRVITKEQKEFLVACRKHEQPINYVKMAQLWEQAGWGKISDSSVKRYWLKVKNEIS